MYYLKFVAYICDTDNREKDMIHSVPNPIMTPEEIQDFLRMLEKCISEDYTEQERAEISKRKERMTDNYNRILCNNGGKNPILGY